MIRHVLREFWGLVRWWWTCDRIRVSPAEGRLLQIRPGDLLTVEITDAEVVHRSVNDGPEGRSLILNCCTNTGSAELHLTVSPKGQVSDLRWRDATGCRVLMATDIRVWSRTGREGCNRWLRIKLS